MAYVWLVSLYYSAPLVLTISAISWYCDRKKRQNKPAIDQFLPINERKTVLITGTNTTKGKSYFAQCEKFQKFTAVTAFDKKFRELTYFQKKLLKS